MAEVIEQRFETSPVAMSRAEFMQAFGGVYEHSPWVAEQVWDKGVTEQQATAEGLSTAMQAVIASTEQQRLLALIRAHPDLAGKAAVQGELTMESTLEQAGAGIDQCSAEEFERFQRLNTAYKERFDFPFVMAVKGSHRHKILAAFEERLENDEVTEFKRAIDEVNKIARFRLDAIAESGFCKVML